MVVCEYNKTRKPSRITFIRKFATQGHGRGLKAVVQLKRGTFSFPAGSVCVWPHNSLEVNKVF